jgi:LacI family transcriptional regulator
MGSNSPALRVTLDQIARAAGVHKTTVSRALRNSPLLPKSTRLRIQKAAQALGYQPDPVLSALSTYRFSRNHRQVRATIAIVTDFPTASGWREYHTGRLYHEGMTAKAHELGFDLEEIGSANILSSQGRLDRVLRARNCTCVIIPSVYDLRAKFILDWDRYSVVTIGFAYEGPEFHRVAHHHRRNMAIALEELEQRGFQRIGFAIQPDLDRRMQNGLSAGFLRWCHSSRLGCSPFLPKTMDQWSPEGFAKWLAHEKPEAVICPIGPEWFERAGFKVPRDVSLIFPDCPSENSPYAGIDTRSRDVGEAAIEQISLLHHHSERGIPLIPRLILVHGIWINGPTLRSPSPRGPRTKNA